MPVHAAGVSRRTFLAQTAAGVASLCVFRSTWGAEQDANPHQLALLSDTHIPSTPETVARNTNMTSNLRQVIKEVVSLEKKPAAVIINGDCAYLQGLPADYSNLAECVAPLAEAKLPLHLTMGNHDDRGPCFDALQAQKPERPMLASKHVSIIESPHANWFLLDSLTKTNVVTGEIGDEQRSWLAKALSERRNKPAIVMTHHTPQFEPPAEGKVWGGLKDTQQFLELLANFDHVKAFVYGHSHTWNVTKRDKLQLINLPPVAYVFGEGMPNGWVLADSRENGLDLELRTIDAGHKQNRERISFDWS